VVGLCPTIRLAGHASPPNELWAKAGQAFGGLAEQSKKSTTDYTDAGRFRGFWL
jgi:hypothetical protein